MRAHAPHDRDHMWPTIALPSRSTAPRPAGAGSTLLTLTYSTLLTLTYTLAWSCYADTYRHIQLHVSGLPAHCEWMREDLYRVSMQEPVDLAVQEDDLFR